MERKLSQKIKELRTELDKVLSKGGRSSLNSHYENKTGRETDDNYISLENFKKESKELLQRYKEVKGIDPSKLIYALVGMSSSRWKNITTSSALRFISKDEAESFGNYMGINGIQLFKNCELVYNTVSIEFPKDGWKIDSSLFTEEYLKNISLFREVLGINYDIYELMESERFTFYRKEVARFVIDILDATQDLNLSDKKKDSFLKEFKMEEPFYKVKEIKGGNYSKRFVSNSIVTEVGMAIANKAKMQKAAEEVEARINQEKQEKNIVISKLLSDLEEASKILSQSEFKIVEEYIHGLTVSKSAKDTLLNQDTNNYLEVSFDQYPKVVSSKSYNEIIPDHQKQEEDDLQVAINLYKEGSSSIQECADIIGMNPSKFRSILISEGIEIKKGKKHPDTFNDAFQNAYWRVKGETLSIKEGAEELGLSYQTFYQRMRTYDKMQEEVLK